MADGSAEVGDLMAASHPVGPFAVARLPRIEFGAGRFETVPAGLARHGHRVLIVTGHHSFRETERFAWLIAQLDAARFDREELTVSGEPSPELVDEAVQRYRNSGIEVVLGIGGGSVLDTAKAVAGLLRPGNSVFDHLEGVGPELPYSGPPTPWIAVPTTAGTGSEATKNAVLSVPGQFKKSFRDERLVAAQAIVDPDLLATCSSELIAANGMDAVTQLIESYVSLRASPFTDALALSGLHAARDGLLSWFQAVRGGLPDAPEAVAGRTEMAYAALLSGITLAQAGLGAAHGLAAALGAFYPIPHGVACGATLVASVELNIAALEERDPDGEPLRRYAEVGRLIAGLITASDGDARRALVSTLDDWRSQLGVPRLGRYGFIREDEPRIVAASRGSSMRTNPIVLTDTEIAAIVERSL